MSPVAHPRRRLRGDEAIYLYLESPRSAMHVGLLCSVDQRLELEPLCEAIQEVISSRDATPALRCRLGPAAGGLLHPSLVDDRDFVAEDHVLEQALSPRETVESVAARLMSEHLDRSRPLWELHLLQPADPGAATTLLFKAHRAVVHEPSGLNLFSLLVGRLNEHERGRAARAAVATAPAHELGTPLPTGEEIEAGEVAPRSLPSELLRSALEAGLSGFDWLRLVGESNRIAVRTLLDVEPELGLPVPRLPFNRLGSGRHRIARLTLSYAEARGIRHALGGSIGDVGLTIVTAALARRLVVASSSGRAGERRLRLLCPMPVQLLGEGSTISTTYLPLALPLHGEELAHTYRAGRTPTGPLRAARVPHALGDLLEVLTERPAPAVKQLARLARFPLLCNLFYTQTAGPQVALRLQDAEIREIHPLNPMLRENGLGLASLSYNQRICFGLRADDLAFPQIGPLRDEIDRAMADLRIAAGVPDLEPIDIGRRRPSAARREAETSTGRASRNRRPA